jgi:hypothetical protein
MKLKIIKLLFFSFILFSCSNSDTEKKINELESKLKKQDELIQQQKIESLESEIEKKDAEIKAIKSKNKSAFYAQGSGLYPQTSMRYLTYSDISHLNSYELKIMRNEIFARHGYIFQTRDMSDYFNAQNWYRPLFNDVSSKLSEIERTNVKFIKQYE